MKKIFLLSAIAISSFIYSTANAQIGVQFHINLGSRPVYVEPTPVYDDADYYYLPDVAAYYSVRQHCYYYNDGYNWISAAYLPGRYHDYDLENARRFEVHESRPYLHDDVYRSRYHGAFEGRTNWGNRDDRDNRVYADRDNRGYQTYNRYNDGQRGYQQQRDDQNRNYGRGQAQGDNRYQQPQQQPQHDNRGGWGGNDNGRNQQQPQQQQQHDNGGRWGGNDNGRTQQQQHDDRGGHGGNDRGGRGNRFS